MESRSLFTANPVFAVQTSRRMILKGISAARRFIYMEDQYLVSLEARNALIAALPNIEHLTILIPHASISDLPQVTFRRQQFIAPLRAAGGTKVRVFFLSPPGAPNTYVHAKMFVFDDEFAIIGTANCNRRSYTHDSEVEAAVFDESSDQDLTHHFAHALRIQLWAKHLNMDTPQGHAELADGVASAVHWLRPRPPGAHVDDYDENANVETPPPPIPIPFQLLLPPPLNSLPWPPLLTLRDAWEAVWNFILDPQGPP